MKTIIIGGVAGGASAAARLRRLDESAEIVLLERGEYISFANCGLPYYIGGVIKQKSALTLQTPASFHARFRIDVRNWNEALIIDKENKTVKIKDLQTGRIYQESYDKLLLSMGAEPIRPNLPGIHSSRVFTLRNIPDTFRIKEYIEQHQPRSALVIGGGYIGIEMAENLHKAGLEVTIAELADHVIASLDFDMAAEVHHYLAQKGIQLLLKNQVQEIIDNDNGLSIKLQNTNIQSDMVIMAVGVTPDTKIAKEAGLSLNSRGAILVDSHMRTSDPDIYAVGDAIQVNHFITNMPAFLPLAGPANKQGRIAADNIFGIASEYSGTQGSSILKLFDMTIAATGINEKTAEESGIDYEKVFLFPDSHAKYYPSPAEMCIKVLFDKQTGRILGAQIIGFDGVDKRCDVFATAIRLGASAHDLTQLELCYAPPFGSAKDPVNMAGYVIENVLSGKEKIFHWHDIPILQTKKDITFLDVRMSFEVNDGMIENAKHIPLDTLREHIKDLDKGKPIYVYCKSGLRSYIACRILTGFGFECYNLSGGYRLYRMVTGQQASIKF